jgi:hypothetical protein
MLFWLLLGVAGLGLAMVGARWFASLPAADLARAFRAFITVAGVLAGSGLLFMGRFGLAVILVSATFMAVRALRSGSRPPDPIGPADDGTGASSAVDTELLAMRLEHGTGSLDGEVRKGPLAGRQLRDLGLDDLLALLDFARRDDPPSVALLETFLDRHFTDWRAQAFAQGGGGSAGDEAMDEETALDILGLEPGATNEAVRAAHRRLMARLHPDHGGSDWLASRINQARDHLLGRRS